jgi:polysaccharide deacetylase family protein (PEP-CTERM system associated)
MKNMRPTHCLTFEIEEHFQVTAFDSPWRRRHWDSFESRVERNTGRLLDLLAEQDAKATFFVLGWVAERHRDLVRRIAREGHEVASRGYASELVTAQTAKSFREDVRKAKQILEDLVGESVPGYRAPHLTINEETSWALPIVAESGYEYDSSLPLRQRRGERDPGNGHMFRRLITESGSLWEVPPSIISLAGLPVVTADGPYFRMLPYPLLRWAGRRAEAAKQPLLLSLCAWEIDPGQPRMSGTMTTRFQHYANLDKVEGRLKLLLQDFRFAAIRDALPQSGGSYRPAAVAGGSGRYLSA